MTEIQQFLETVRAVLKPIEATHLIKQPISAIGMKKKMLDIETKRQTVNQMASGFLSTRNVSYEEIEYLKDEIASIFIDYQKSFNN